QLKGRPTAIVARTIKGKGCSFMENRAEWHGTAPKPDEVERALLEIRG
ncbi:MAG: transketolase, partial [Syntrophomonadaceae bacterium]|nr:transketolase [Syntrophomonadaceae bacterium]